MKRTKLSPLVPINLVIMIIVRLARLPWNETITRAP